MGPGPDAQAVQTARARLLAGLRREIRDERVLAAIGRVPREEFVPPDYRNRAYDDMALPINQGQTISQPFIVALMSAALAIRDGAHVLEVGTGSGYQAAVLAEMGAQVDSVERHPALADEAARRLARLGYRQVSVHVARADVLGWPDAAPYDAILVAAAAPAVPADLLAQLRDGGRMVVPVGTRDDQDLLAVTRRSDRIERVSLGPCRFVPLIGRDAWPDPPAASY
jgi:protein-L-isoaspartate(D-aspartate) O-methyltransferase